MANKKIVDVDTLSSLADSDSLFMNSDGSLKQVAVEDAGLMRMELLWENASPTSAFAAQEIPIDVDPNDYDGVIAVVRLDVSGTTQVGIYFDSGTNGLAYTAGWYGDRAGVTYRSFTYEKTTAKRYTVSGGTYFNDLVNTTSNSYCIPYRIYGIKGIQ